MVDGGSRPRFAKKPTPVNLKIRKLSADGSVPNPVDGSLAVKAVPAFPKLKWEDPTTESGMWEPVDENARAQKLRLMELTHAGPKFKGLVNRSKRFALYIVDGVVKIVAA